jgi:tRNA-specific 2-thiouridylase
MTRRERVLVAMSGGVDSSVAALRLVRAGFEVVGVTLHLWDYPEEVEDTKARCCAPEDQHDARRVADALDIGHYVFDRRELFRREVVEPFVGAYLEGRTPSPCNDCNRTVKLTELFHVADTLGARFVATGHYARILEDSRGSKRIARGRDAQKDQSYFLHATPRAQIDRLLFPLGESSKAEVRAEAIEARLPGATKGESQELCFIGAGDGAYAAFVEERGAGRVRPGPIVDEAGRVLAHHDGVHRFTVGQRKGLGIATGKPTFVERIDGATGTVHVASGERLLGREAIVEELLLGDGVALPLSAVRVRVRYRHEGSAARVEAYEGGARVVFDEPTRAVTPGQVAVFYEGDCVVGGGRIAQGAAAGDAEARAS